jgi:hypothetical protein
MRAALASTCIAFLLVGAGGQANPARPSPAQILQLAFDARYACAVTGVIEIETRKGESSAQRRRMDVASKSINGRLHTYAVFREPPHVRGVAFLGIEAKSSGRSEERFVYLPSLRKIRRVSGSQSDDAFLGTDLSYHDFERQREASFDVAIAGKTRIGADGAWIVTAKPHVPMGYEHVEHTIAERDYAILATRYFKRGAATAYKRLEMDRARMIERGACRVPARILVKDAQRGTSTVLDVTALTLDAQLPDDLFSMTALDTKRPVPGIP